MKPPEIIFIFEGQTRTFQNYFWTKFVSHDSTRTFFVTCQYNRLSMPRKNAILFQEFWLMEYTTLKGKRATFIASMFNWACVNMQILLAFLSRQRACDTLPGKCNQIFNLE